MRQLKNIIYISNNMTKEEIKKMLINVYRERQKAHDKLLECDIMIDKLLHELL